MKVTFVAIAALMVLVIFVEGIMIIDQEIRINAMKKKVQEVTGEVDKTIERANQFISMQEDKQLATTTEQYEDQ